jgi:hypothetical protein
MERANRNHVITTDKETSEYVVADGSMNIAESLLQSQLECFEQMSRKEWTK